MSVICLRLKPSKMSNISVAKIKLPIPKSPSGRSSRSPSSRSSSSPSCGNPRRRNYREERGDFTIALLLLAVVLLGLASVAYAWPKAISTRLTVDYIGEESLKAGAIYAEREAPFNASADAKLELVKEGMESFIDGSRINGVTITIVEGPSCGMFQGEPYLRASLEWLFLNPRSVVDIPGDITRSIQHPSSDDFGVCDS